MIENLYDQSKKRCRCDCGNTIDVITTNLINGNTQSCGCLKSKGELKINELLTKMMISYKTQYSFEDCRFPGTNRLAYFDYAIFQNNKLICLIEYDGTQHYTGWGQSALSLAHILNYDNYKSLYCKTHQIPLIRIPYTDYNDLSEEYLRNKINEAIK